MNDEAKQDSILDFWFGPLADAEAYPADKQSSWFKKDDAFDATIRARFGEWVEAALDGDYLDWLTTPKGEVAYVVLLDQFPRNIFRGTGRMFAGDELTRPVVRDGVLHKRDETMPRIHRAFFYMPLMHSESLSDQKRSVELFARLAATAPDQTRGNYANNHEFAVKHYDIVAKYGRFPHRNELLGRASSEEEQAFLSQPGSSF